MVQAVYDDAHPWPTLRSSDDGAFVEFDLEPPSVDSVRHSSRASMTLAASSPLRAGRHDVQV